MQWIILLCHSQVINKGNGYTIFLQKNNIYNLSLLNVTNNRFSNYFKKSLYLTCYNFQYLRFKSNEDYFDVNNILYFFILIIKWICYKVYGILRILMIRLKYPGHRIEINYSIYMTKMIILILGYFWRFSTDLETLYIWIKI